VVVLLLDATRGLEHQDLKIASMVLEEGRALIIAINKWDVAEDASGLFNGVRQALDDGLAQVRGVPLVAVSARTGKGLDTLLGAAFSLRDAWSRRVPTAALNRWFDDALAANPPPAPGGKRIKLRYITQAKTRPPGFVLFGTRLDMLPESYRRYLVNGIRRELGFDAVPIRLTLRSPKNRSPPNDLARRPPAIPGSGHGARGRGHCPRCGQARLFARWLKPVDHCPACGQDWRGHRADDFPLIAILVTGHVMAPVLIALGLETTLSAPVMMALCLIPTAGLVLGLLPVAKGAVIALQWWLGLHGFATAPGRDLVEK
jgi:uncharacterized protein (DUF983 family)